MRYLKKFNEAAIDLDERNQIAELAKESMVELLDRNFEIFIVGHQLQIRNIKTFKWDDVKDSVIPFMEILSNEYRIQPQFSCIYSGRHDVELSSILNDEVSGFNGSLKLNAIAININEL